MSLMSNALFFRLNVVYAKWTILFFQINMCTNALTNPLIGKHMKLQHRLKKPSNMENFSILKKCSNKIDSLINCIWNAIYIRVAGRFAYKSIRIHRGCFADTTLVDSHTMKSIRLHWNKNRSHKHSNRIAIGLTSTQQYARVVIMCRTLFLFGTANALTAHRLSSSLIRVSGRFATKSIRFKSFRYNSTVDSLHICSRFATHSLKHKSRFATETYTFRYKRCNDQLRPMVFSSMQTSSRYFWRFGLSYFLNSERMTVTISDYVKL